MRRTLRVSAAQPLARSEGMALPASTARQVNMLKPQRSWLVPPAACAKICEQERKQVSVGVLANIQFSNVYPRRRKGV